jgi:hypothetical protein
LHIVWTTQIGRYGGKEKQTMTQDCVCCGSAGSMSRFENDALTTEYAGLTATVGSL